MTQKVEFYYDYSSPASYLAYTQLPEIVQKTGSEIVYKPFLLGGVFKSSGNTSPMIVPNKAAWMVKDMFKYAKRYGVELKISPHFPVNSIQLMRGAIWAKEKGILEKYDEAMFRAVWVQEKNVNDLEELAGILKEIDIDPNEFGEAVADQAIKDKLRAETDNAVKRGAFGAPTMFVGDEMFWGQDRLDFVEEALSK